MSWPGILHSLFTRRWQSETFGVGCYGGIDGQMMQKFGDRLSNLSEVQIWRLKHLEWLKAYEKFESFYSYASLDANTRWKWKSGSLRVLWFCGLSSHRPKDLWSWPESRKETCEEQEVSYMSVALVVSWAVSRGSKISSDCPLGICSGWL